MLFILGCVIHLMVQIYICRPRRVTMEPRIVWQSQCGEYNPSLYYDTILGDYQIAIRSSNRVSKSVWAKLKQLPLYSYTMRREQVYIYRLIDSEYHQHVHHSLPWLVPNKVRFLIEDPRWVHCDHFSNERLILCTIYPEHGGNPQCILHFDACTGQVAKVSLLHPMQETSHDKNWTLFQTRNQQKWLLTDIHPYFTIRSFDFPLDYTKIEKGLQIGHCHHAIAVRHKSPFAENRVIRCTAAPVKWNKSSFLCIAHEVTRDKLMQNYRSLFIVFTNMYPFNLLAYSEPVQFFARSYIEFASGLEIKHGTNGNSYLIGLGVNDEYGYVIEVLRSQIEASLVYV
jgi:hypothetical protein